MEILMVTGLLAYIMNYIIGKNKNNRLAHAWFNTHRELLESNFALVGKFCSAWGAFSTCCIVALMTALDVDKLHASLPVLNLDNGVVVYVVQKHRGNAEVIQENRF